MSFVSVFFLLLFLVLLSGSNYYVRILSTIDRELLKPNASVALHKHSNALVDVLPPEADSSIMMLTSGKTPGTTFSQRFSGSVLIALSQRRTRSNEEMTFFCVPVAQNILRSTVQIIEFLISW